MGNTMHSSGLQSSSRQAARLPATGGSAPQYNATQYTATRLVSAQLLSGNEPATLARAVGGFALDGAHNDDPAQGPLHRRRNRLERMVEGMERALPLPTSPRGYLLYLCWLVLIVGGMGILTLMSAQIMQARMELRTLRAEHTLIQQRNSELVWLIARETNLERVRRRLAGKGYIAAGDLDYDMQYVVLDQPNADASGSDTPRLVDSLETPASLAATVNPDLLNLDTQTAAAPDLNSLDNSLDATEMAQAPSVPTTAIDAPSATGANLEATHPDATSWTAALGEGIGRWEMLFLNSRPERPAAALRSPELGAPRTGKGSWQTWWEDLSTWSSEELAGLSNALSWGND
ncbi:MAG: hypothetical protein WDZ49_01645 [Litorilinea sp.]